MKRNVLHAFQWTLVTFLIVTMGTSPASAGWLLKRLRCKVKSARQARCAPACPTTCSSVAISTPIPTIAPFISSPVISAPIVSAPIPYSQPIVHSAPIYSAPILSAPVYSPVVSQPIYSEPIVSAPVQDCCCCDNGIDSGGTIDGGVVQAAPIVNIGESVIVDSPPAFDTVDYGTPLDAGAIISDAPIVTTPLVEEAGSLSDQPVDMNKNMDMETPPAPDAMSDPVAEVGANPAAPAEKEGMEDMFGSGDPPATNPMPADTTPDPEPPAAPSDDLFGGGAPEPEPAAEPAGGDSGLDDLFGGGNAAPAAAEPATDSAPPADPFGAPPADETPADPPAPAGDGGLDDLFGGGGDAPAAMQPDVEVATAGGDDLFGGEAQDAAAPAGDSLFGEPVEEAMEKAAPASEEAASTLDDLFGATETIEPIEESMPVVTEPAPVKEEPAKLSIEDLFGTNVTEPVEVGSVEELPAPIEVAPAVEVKSGLQVVSIMPERSIDPLADTHVRTWIDNTGKHSTVGRLIEINPENIRLMKSNGRTCTVPLSRMCPADSAYVDSIRKEVASARIALLSSK